MKNFFLALRNKAELTAKSLRFCTEQLGAISGLSSLTVNAVMTVSSLPKVSLFNLEFRLNTVEKISSNRNSEKSFLDGFSLLQASFRN